MRSSESFRLLVPLVMSGLVLTTSAYAQDRVTADNGEGMDTHLFRPAVDSKGFFTVNGSGVLGANELSFGLITDYGRNLMRLSPNHGAPAMVENSFQGTFHVNYGIGDVAIVGVTVPVHLMSGEALTAIGPSGSTYDSGKLDTQNFGNVALHAKLRLLRVEKGLGLALLAQVGTSPSESVERGLGADKVFYWPQLIVERRFGPTGRFRVGANVGYRGHTQNNPRFDQIDGGPSFEYGNLVTGGLGISYRALDSLDLVAETYLSQLLGDSSDSKLALSDEVALGIKVFVEKNSYLMLGGGMRTTRGFQAADQRGFIGFIFEPSVGDRDGDGIPDDVDLCPDEPENFNGFEDDDGCPDYRPARLLTAEEASDGDRDGDGIPDSLDLCPDEPEDFDGFEDEDGCPDPDNDKDGIPDELDKCPNEPETFNGFQDEDGCPDQGRVVVEDQTILINDKVQFKTNSAEILAESDGLLDAMAATLLQHSELVLIEVQGHADERAPENHNLRLTQQRASSVVDALVRRGVSRERLRPMGYGEYCPLDPASNPQAWETNRRVELKVVKTASGPTGAPLGCELARKKGVVAPAN